jgi:ABC-type branched-subunit amino acid transport system substrate-binding protein
VQRSIPLIGALVALLVTASACSSTSRGGSSAGPGSTGPVSSATSSTTAPASTTTKFGTLDSPCGPGDASGATDQGVTDTAIRIGYGDDRGAQAIPGLNKDIGDAVQAMIAWCNEQGGINGRKITGDFYDAAITNIAPAIKSACKNDFMLVGEGWSADEAIEGQRVACNLPAVPAFTVGPDFANGPMMYQALPNPDDYQIASVFYQVAKLFPDVTSQFALQNLNLPAIEATNAKVQAAAVTAGYKVLNCGVTMNYTGEPNYTPFAQKFKQCGAKAIYLGSTPGPDVEGLLTAISQLGDNPIYLAQSQFYDPGMAKWNTAGYADRMYVMSDVQPMENADKVPAVQDYLRIVKAINGKTGALGEQATSSFLLWATAAKQCGSNLTRQCMIDNLSKVHDWTGGGLNGPTDPGANLPGGCGMILKLNKTSWTQFYPSEAGQFDCNASYAVKTPKQTWGTTLNADRIATRFLTKDYLKPQS